MKNHKKCWHRSRCYYLHRPCVESQRSKIKKELSKGLQTPYSTPRGATPQHWNQIKKYVIPGEYLYNNIF
jgi:hypothetical protein